MASLPRLGITICLGFWVGCSSDPVGYGGSQLHGDDAGAADGAHSTGGGATSSDGVDAGGSDSGPGSQTRFDVDTPDAPDESGACSIVDVLFVVDNSGSMGDEQLNLVGSFPGFIDGIQTLLGPGTSYHIGVITTDDNTFNMIGCQRLGALTTKTGGDLSSNAICGPYANGGAFMTSADALDETFSCAAMVGIDGSGFEKPMDAITATVQATDPGTALCNDGFLRPEALLVLVLITDEEDMGDSEGDPATWYDTVVLAKAGDPDKVVVLSLIGHPKPNDCLPTQWTGMQGAEIAPRLIEFTEMFPHGLVRDICSPSYTDYFAETVDGIAEACSVPVG